jgi:Leucine-rich repeat (LRR) protein
MYSIYPNLEYLVLANNPFGGRISGLLGKLVALRTLKINNCTLTGLLPENIWDLQDLEIFDFQDNAIGGTIPQSFGTLGVLRELKFKNNNLTGTLPIQLGSLDQLNILNLANNKLTGEVPTVIGFLSKLVEFDVSGNLFVGTVPEGVCVNVNMTRAMVGCSLECSCCSDDGTNICAGNNQGGLRRNRH